MTGEQTVQVITALIPAILAFFAVVGSVVTAVLAYKTSKKSDEIITKTNVIEHTTNSNLSRVTAALELSQAEFRGLKDSSAAEIRTLGETIKRMVGDKTVADVVASKLAEVTPKAMPKTLTDATVKLKEDIVIEGTLETKE